MDKPMRFAVEAAAGGREAYDESPCDYTAPGREESQRLVALAIQRAAEPLLAVVERAIREHKWMGNRRGPWLECLLCEGLGGPPKDGSQHVESEHEDDCPVPAALKAMEQTDEA